MSDKFIVNKQNDVSTLDASEWNQFAEINNFLVSAGITPDGSVLNQIAKGIANYSSASNFFAENGTVNNYTLIANNNFLAPTAYIAGMVIRFITTNANTTTTPTVNLNGLGAKNILKADCNPVIAGDVSGYVELRYNGTNFLLSPLSSALNITATNKGLTYLNNPITIANNATDTDNDIDFSAGNFQFSDKSNEAVLLAMTKRLDASWTVGNNQGGLDTGSKANSTWYHCYAIYNPTSGVSDAIFSANATTPTLPSGYTKYKLIESILTNSSGNILAFYHVGNYISWKTKIKDITSSLSTSLTPHPISTPLGRSVMVKVRATLYTGGASSVNILSPYDNSLTPLSSENDLVSQNYTTSIEKEVITDTSSQISIIASAAPVNSFTLFTYGWEKIN